MEKTTEQESGFKHLDVMSAAELLSAMNAEDMTVPGVVGKSIPAIEIVVNAVVERMRRGGRVFYTGAGTSGRLGVVDASEIPPTYGVRDRFIGVIAGGDGAIRSAVEGAEDDAARGWRDIEAYNPGIEDTVIGISASGSAPYVVGAVTEARSRGLFTSCITCNEGSALASAVEAPIVAVVGPEFVTGSTRMKAGTCTKLILNMISTSVMVLLGHVRGNRMVDMQLTNKKLVDRGTRMIMDAVGIDDYDTAKALLLEKGSVRSVIEEKNI